MQDEAYKYFAAFHHHPWCWYCGRGAMDGPFQPFLIERAHIVNKPRVEDVRAVMLLCSLCHRRQHGAIIVSPKIEPFKELTLQNMLWLKKYHDPDNYDRQWLQDHHDSLLPQAARPSKYFEQHYKARRGQPWTIVRPKGTK